MAVKTTPVICPYCGVGCGLYIKAIDGRYAGIEYYYDHPVNKGKLCPKANDLSFLSSPERLTKPLKRTESGFKEISWSEAIREVASRLKEYWKSQGADVLAFMASAKCTNEENYLMQKLARIIGTNNVDHCARLCHAPTIAGLRETTGSGALTCSYLDISRSDVVVLWGTNPAETYPVLMRYILSVKNKGGKIIVVDPVKTRSARFADIYLPIVPGTDILVANAIMNVLIKEDLYDKEFIETRAEGFKQLVKTVEKYTPEKLEEEYGIPSHLVREVAYTMASTRNGSLLWAMGVTQHIKGYKNVLALATLGALLGWYGREGACVGGLRGQVNVQGACDMGALATCYPGYVDVNNEKEVRRIAELWGVDELPLRPGFTVIEMAYAAEKGWLKAIYIMGENPVISDANAEHVKKALGKLEFLVVQDIFLSETAELADIVLPAAALPEREGSLTNSERRVQWTFKALEPPGEARPDLNILIEIAKHMGLEKHFPYSSPEDVLLEINKAIPFYAGITPDRLKSSREGIFWPCPSPDHPGIRLLHKEKFRTPSGKFKIAAVEYEEPAEKPDDQYPLILTTHRVVGMFHTLTMTNRSPLLRKRWPGPYALIHPETASKHGVRDGDKIKIITRRGEYLAIAKVTDKVLRNVVSLPWHWGGNIITSDALDPVVKIPETKVSACRIEKV